nr:type II toxin-antitoxin system RelE/ParE family toxin [Pseudoflavonifractor capillosus]
MAQCAPDLHEPHTKHIDGPIWELRSKFSSNIYCIFYFIWDGNKLVLLHGFTKKTQKTPPTEIAIAKKRMEDYQSRAQ